MIVLALALLLVNVGQLNVYEPNDSVPFVNVAVSLIVNASCSVHVPPTPLKVNPIFKVAPFVVIVFEPLVAANIKAAPRLLTVTVGLLPNTVKLP